MSTPLFDWRSRKAKRIVIQALRTALPLVKANLDDFLVNRLGKAKQLRKTEVDCEDGSALADTTNRAAGKPTIFVSACVDRSNPGGWRYNGGIKEYNLLIKLLRSKGFGAFLVTYDGSYVEWLIDHQAAISIIDLKQRTEKPGNFRFLTSWALARTYLESVDQVYFWDMELYYTENEQYPLLSKLYEDGRIRKTAGISRTIQAWHMARFQRHCVVIPNLIDLSLWKPEPMRRVAGRIGYMREGDHADAFVSALANRLDSRGIAHECVLISGDEATVRDAMQTCDLYVSLNLGKDPFWGEGCPRTIIESMAAGCVNLSFDIIGNRETVVPGWNAVLVPHKTAESLATAVGELLLDRDGVEQMRERSLAMVETCHSFDARWPSIKAFLDL